MVTDDRWRRTLRKRRRQRVLQLRLDGNVPTQKQNYHRPIYDHTYNEIKVRPSPTNLGATGGAVLERAVQFNGALRDRVFSWQRAVQPEKSSSNPNDDSDHKVKAKKNLSKIYFLLIVMTMIICQKDRSLLEHLFDNKDDKGFVYH